MDHPTHISPDELAYLTRLGEQERQSIAALRMTRQSFESHLAEKYGLTQGDTVRQDGQIVRTHADVGSTVS